MVGPGPEEFRIVVAPATRFAAIDSALAEIGLALGPDDAVTPPAIPGEREFAYWTSPEGDAIAHYSFNPAVLLRVLAFSGGDARRLKAEATERLPLLDPAGIRRLLRSEERREILLGLFAAAELKSAALLADVEPLRIHRDQLISGAAGRTAESLALAILAAGAERLESEQRRRPDRSALFPRLGDAARRRAVLVWLVLDGHEANDEVARVLRTALEDEDWRVRATAVIVAARLGAAAVWPAVRKAELPTNSRSGLDGAGRDLLRATRKAALAELAGEPVPAGADEKSRLMVRLRDALAGRDGGGPDEVRDWVESWLELPAEAG
jgi:hypothetical protein